MTIQGNGQPNQVVIDAQGLNQIFTINTNQNVTFINITFINGIDNNYGSGAIYSDIDNIGFITIINCNFVNNTGTNASNSDGAVSNYGATLLVINSTFTNNSCPNGIGGAIYNYKSGKINVINSSFINNSATSGGAIHNEDIDFYVSNSRFINNTEPHGGAIDAYGNNITVKNSNFTNNTAYQAGCAIYNNGANLIVNNSNFINNTANSTNTNSGAIYNTGANFSINSSNFTENYVIGVDSVIYTITGLIQL